MDRLRTFISIAIPALIALAMLSLGGCATRRPSVKKTFLSTKTSARALQPQSSQVRLVAFAETDEGLSGPPSGDSLQSLDNVQKPEADEPALLDDLEDDDESEDEASPSDIMDAEDESSGANDEGDREEDTDKSEDDSDDSDGEEDDSDLDDEDDDSESEDEDPLGIRPQTEREECSNANALRLDQVLGSVAASYPLLDVAMNELAAAEGKALATWGNFDTVLSAYTFNKPLGFYETYRHGFKASRPLWNGGEVYGGYRIGRGVFEPWYQERQTNEGGEFKTGVKLPLMKGFATDGRRTAVQVANLERLRLEPDIRARVIEMQRAATQLYWKWVAAGQVVRTQEYLLKLARVRNESLIEQVKEEDLPKITEIDNGRFIAKRQAKLIESRRKVQQAAIKLSLFLRDQSGQPVVAGNELLPCDFPQPSPTDTFSVESDIAQAIAQRPELREYDFQAQQVQAELCYARNQTLPKLDAYAETGQDVGEPTSSTRDKSELEIELGLLAEVPLQRRSALGKIRAAEAKLAQISAKRRFAEDKIRSQVLDAVSALDNAYERIEQARENLRLTEQSLRLGRLSFDEGDIDIIKLNIYETSLAEAELLLIEAEFTYFNAMADYRAALAIQFQDQ